MKTLKFIVIFCVLLITSYLKSSHKIKLEPLKKAPSLDIPFTKKADSKSSSPESSVIIAKEAKEIEELKNSNYESRKKENSGNKKIIDEKKLQFIEAHSHLLITAVWQGDRNFPFKKGNIFLDCPLTKEDFKFRRNSMSGGLNIKKIVCDIWKNQITTQVVNDKIYSYYDLSERSKEFLANLSEIQLKIITYINNIYYDQCKSSNKEINEYSYIIYLDKKNFQIYSTLPFSIRSCLENHFYIQKKSKKSQLQNNSSNSSNLSCLFPKLPF